MIPVAVGFGGNLGQVDQAFARALDALRGTPGLRVRAVSGLYRSAPWGRADQPDFLNGVVRLAVRVDPEGLLARLRALEADAGRIRRHGWGPRTLDLDLLYYGNVVSREAGLVIPHPLLPERTFVLRPLAEIDPAWRHPLRGETAAEMLEALEASGHATPCEPIPGLRIGDRSGALETMP